MYISFAANWFSIRSFLIGSISQGISIAENILESEDVYSTINCLKACGASINKNGEFYTVNSNSLSNPNSPLNCRNSGTTMRLLTGLLAGQKIEALLYGDASLSKRPMDRIIEPLKKMGIENDKFFARVKGYDEYGLWIYQPNFTIPKINNNKPGKQKVEASILIPWGFIVSIAHFPGAEGFDFPSPFDSHIGFN